MGIKGLTSLIRDIPSLPTEYVFHEKHAGKNSVTIDGAALLYQLFFQNANWLYGGDYQAFSKATSEYLLAMSRVFVNIDIFMDGMACTAKWAAIQAREKTRVAKAVSVTQTFSNASDLHQAAKEIQGSDRSNLLPILAHTTFMTTIRGLKSASENGTIALHVCDEESDNIIACFARQNKTFVISNDSDFYIYPLQKGYLPIDQIRINKDDHTVTVQVYKYTALAGKLGFSPKKMPLFACLAPNDFVAPEVSTSLVYNLHAMVNNLGHARNVPARSVDALTHLKNIAAFLKRSDQFTSESEASGAELLTPDVAKKILDIAIKLISAKHVDVARQHWVYALKFFLVKEYKLETYSTKTIPQLPKVREFTCPELAAYTELFHKGLIHPRTMQVLVRSFFFVQNTMEDTSLPSFWLGSLEVRKFLYAIAQQDIKGPVRELVRVDTLDSSRLSVKTYDHEDYFCTADGNNLPMLADIPKVSAERRAHLWALGAGVPASKLEVWDQFASALPAGLRFILASLIALARSNELPNRVLAAFIASYLCKHRASSLNPQHTLDLADGLAQVHLFVTWQGVLFSLEMLNQVLLSPLPPLRPQDLVFAEKFHHYYNVVADQTDLVALTSPPCAQCAENTKIASVTQTLVKLVLVLSR